MNSKIGSLTGETDLHFSKDRIYPHWFCYAMRERAPYKELINKWFELFDSIHFLAKTFFSFFKDFANCRVWPIRKVDRLYKTGFLPMEICYE